MTAPAIGSVVLFEGQPHMVEQVKVSLVLQRIERRGVLEPMAAMEGYEEYRERAGILPVYVSVHDDLDGDIIAGITPLVPATPQ